MNIHIKILKWVVAVTLTAAATACADSETAPDQPGTGERRSLSFYAADMVPQFVDPTDVASRAGDPKTEAEKEIKTLHVFFFNTDADGKPAGLAQFEYDNFTPYQKIKGNVITIPDAAITDGQLNGLKIVAIANINGADGEPADAIGTPTDPNMFWTDYSTNGKIENGTRDSSTPYKITSYSDLKSWVYRPKLRSEEGTPVTDLPKAGMPMTGESDVLNTANLSGNLIVQMKAMMARVDISVKLEPNQESLNGQLPVMTIDSYGVLNMPSRVPFESPAVTDVAEEGNPEKPDRAKIEPEFQITLDNPVRIDKNTATPPTFTYYTYENIQEKKADINEAVPDNLKNLIQNYTDAEKEKVLQRWKPRIAKEGLASALVLTGTYTTHKNMTYKARFTIYMGADPVDKFDVRRNHKYNNYITIHGLDYVRNSADDTYTFDGRVNVVTDNPVYLAIVNERKVDAHASVRPMDVWLLLREPDPKDPEQKVPEVSHNSTVRVKVPDDCDWIRMVMVPRAEMKAGNWQAGTGAEPYFTTDLFTRIDNRSILSGHNAGADCGKEVTISSTPELNNSRSRIYFYIDENVNVDDPNYGDRTARIEIEYTNDKDGGDVRHRYLEIEQRALVKVDRRHSNGEINTWMEYYEEYLEHNDPLDKHNMPGELYSGLKWGLKGQRVRRAAGDRIDGTEVFRLYTQNDPFAYSLGILDYSTQLNHPLSEIHLYNSSEPYSAFHYVLGKNKRNSVGGISDNSYGWYMPGISELESAFVQHYVTFEDFHDNFYWSAACGKYTVVIDYEYRDRARATKVVFDNNGIPSYVESSGEASGSKDRDEELRIRAFYKPKPRTD